MNKRVILAGLIFANHFTRHLPVCAHCTKPIKGTIRKQDGDPLKLVHPQCFIPPKTAAKKRHVPVLSMKKLSPRVHKMLNVRKLRRSA